MFIRKKKRSSRRGTVYDFYIVESQRTGTAKGPTLKVLGYIGCIRESLINDPNEQRFFWKSSPATAFSQEHKGAEEKIRDVLTTLFGVVPQSNLRSLMQQAESYVPKPPPKSRKN